MGSATKRKMGEVICDSCDKNFEKPLSEINRNNKLGRKNFCSRHCVGIHNTKNLLSGNKSVNDISKYSNNRKDVYTKFKYHYRSILSRNKIVDVTIEDLLEQWELQNGKCFYTNIELVLSTYSKIKKDPIYSASLDRVDSSKGYVKGNIRWVSRSINYMKNDMSDDKVFELFDIIQNIKK